MVDVFSRAGILLNLRGELKVKFDDIDSTGFFTGEIFMLWALFIGLILL